MWGVRDFESLTNQRLTSFASELKSIGTVWVTMQVDASGTIISAKLWRKWIRVSYLLAVLPAYLHDMNLLISRKWRRSFFSISNCLELSTLSVNPFSLLFFWKSGRFKMGLGVLEGNTHSPNSDFTQLKQLCLLRSRSQAHSRPRDGVVERSSGSNWGDHPQS